MEKKRDSLVMSDWPPADGSPLRRLSVGEALRDAVRAAPYAIALVEGTPDPAARWRWTYRELLPGYRDTDMRATLAGIRAELPRLREVVLLTEWDEFLSSGGPGADLSGAGPDLTPGAWAAVSQPPKTPLRAGRSPDWRAADV